MSPRELQKRLATIRKMERAIRPDADWVLRNREALLKRVEGDIQHASRAGRSFPQVVKEFYRSFLPTELIAVVRGPAFALFSGVAVVLSGSIASVSAAERAVPGDFLYPVKIAAEQTRLALATGKTDKIRLKTEFVTRRVDEIKQLTKTEPKKPEQLKEAAENLKRDLDTVKNQLTDTQDEQPVDRTKLAKLVDDTGTSVAASLKEVKITADPEARSQLTEAEVAAVNTSVKAVQVILETQSDAESQKVVSREQLIQSISAKVDGVEIHLTDTAQQLVQTVSTTTFSFEQGTASTTASSTIPQLLNSVSATSSVPEILAAHASLNEAKQLLIENKIQEVTNKLVEANRDVATADKKIERIAADMASSTSSQLVPLASASSSTTSTVSQPLPVVPATTTASSTEVRVETKGTSGKK
jgi:hypothetical protein